MCVSFYVNEYVFISPGYILRNCWVLWYQKVSLFEVLSNCLPECYTILHVYKQCEKVSISPHPLRHLLLYVFALIILVGIRCCLILVLICISLMTKDVDHLFMYILTICVSSSENAYSKPFLIFQLGCLFKF